jgi:hypothetical protein
VSCQSQLLAGIDEVGVAGPDPLGVQLPEPFDLGRDLGVARAIAEDAFGDQPERLAGLYDVRGGLGSALAVPRVSTRLCPPGPLVATIAAYTAATTYTLRPAGCAIARFPRSRAIAPRAFGG